MKYFVKNADGELTFASIHELRAMFQQGLVEAEDEVRADDSTIWRKAGAIPELREAAAARNEKSYFGFAVVTLICLTFALGILFSGRLTLVTRVVLAAAMMIPAIGMSQRAFTKAIKREKR